MLFVSLVERYTGGPFSFASDDIVVGRADDADLVIANDKVAPKHIRVRVDGGAVVVEDVRGPVPRSRQVVTGDDVVRIGGVGLKIARHELQLAPVADDVEQQLLDRIRAAPADPELREVYADWLDEHGRVEHAAFLRTQLALAGARDAEDVAFGHASARLAELAGQVEPAWRARVAMAFVEQCPSQLAKLRPWNKKLQALAMELVCPQRWDALAPTARDGVRHCGACKQDVHYTTSVEQARALAIRGACVAIDVSQTAKRYRGDLDDPSTMVVGRPSPPLARYGSRRG